MTSSSSSAPAASSWGYGTRAGQIAALLRYSQTRDTPDHNPAALSSSSQASTYSWWAAFLSSATEIHYPLAGFLHPLAYMPSFDAIPPGELTVYDEERFIYHDLLARKWWGRFDVCTDSFVYDYETE